ncbi:MAG TPA: extracellular solute-binding protein [Actinomycetota bacterium]|jgi:raffinose/stachyose/melibiose transport system substrate-binding protein|nr:extracellular solute-binding protein [Actinomycetota bacterium]
MAASSPIAARRRIGLAALFVLVGAACTPGGETSQVSVPPPPASTGVTETGPITLTIWDQESGAPSRVWDQLIGEFEQKYPNVTIKRVNRDFGELKTLLKLAISGPHPPDVVEANQGWPDMGQLVKAGLLLPLDNYAEAYGWYDRVPGNVLAVSSWTPDGKQFGTGNLFGFTSLGEIVGVYYNKNVLADLGLTVPTTLEEFEQDLVVAKQAGEVPIMFGNNDAFPGIHEYVVIQDRLAPVSYLTDFIFGLQRNELSFDTPENVQAATILQDWAESGYFTPGFGGGGYQTAVNNFAKGQGLFMITGNWIVGDLGADNTDFGFFVMPPTEAGQPPVSTGGAGFPLSITSGSEHPDAAAAWIDWMTSDHAVDLLLETGQIPLNTAEASSSIEPGTVLADVVNAASAMSKADGVVPYEDWATPTFYDTMTAAIQELMGLRITPEAFVAKIQQDYADFQSTRA